MEETATNSSKKKMEKATTNSPEKDLESTYVEMGM